MSKIKLFTTNNMGEMERWVNEFIKDKAIVDIKFSSVIFYDEFRNGLPSRVTTNDRVMVIYNEVN